MSTEFWEVQPLFKSERLCSWAAQAFRKPSSTCSTLLDARQHKHSPHASSLDDYHAWRLSTSLIYACAVRLTSIKFTCRRRRWRSTKEENTTFRHASADADTLTKSCPPRCSGFRWTLHIIFFGRAPA
jgi:hypothetical protein